MNCKVRWFIWGIVKRVVVMVGMLAGAVIALWGPVLVASLAFGASDETLGIIVLVWPGIPAAIVALIVLYVGVDGLIQYGKSECEKHPM